MAASLLSSLTRRAATAAAMAAALVFVSAQNASAQSLIRDAEIEDTLRVYANPIFEAAGVRGDEVEIHIINDDSVNAFVINGQNMFVHTGLLMRADNPNEIIGVLAHETGHIAGGHVQRSRGAINQAMGPMLISIGLGVLAIAAGAPDAGAALIAGSQQFAMADFVRFSQAQESSADQAGATFLEASGQSGRGLISFFDHEIRPYEFMVRRAPPWMMTHPFASDRVEALRQRVESASHRDAVDTEDNIRRFQFMQAKLIGFIRSESQTLSRYPLSDHSAPARYARAIAYYRAAKLDRATAELNSLIAEEPRNPYYQELMGQILFENGHADQAIPYHRRSLEYAPGEPLLQVNLARALIAGGGNEGASEAIGLLNSVLAHEPDNGFAWREMATARYERGEEALAELASAEQSFSLGDYRTALSFAERARRALPRNTPDFQRASDIANFAGDEMRRRDEQRGRT
ncbi:MAG: M48 family metalloprotease [Hyphomonadaceae bacterium]